MVRRSLTALATLLGAVLLVVTSALPAWAAQSITLTWVRHAQSTANAAGIIDTTVPGPGLTALGEMQAQAIAEALNATAYDGIFVSNMVRTQLTAAPLAADLSITPVVLPGLREINAGIFEGRGGPIAAIGYALPPAAWILGNRIIPVLGGENGNAFEARVNNAVAQICATGDTNPIAFSHGGTIMAWTLMNVDNPNLFLALTHPLGNTAVVVVTGNPEDGWTLQSWDGVGVDPEPGLLTKVFVGVRSLVVAPQTAVYNVLHRNRPPDGVVPPAGVAAPVALPDTVPPLSNRAVAPTEKPAVSVQKRAGGAVLKRPSVRVLPKPAASQPDAGTGRQALNAEQRGDGTRRPARAVTGVVQNARS